MRRFAATLFGLILATNLGSHSRLWFVVGVVGVAIVLAASGVVELAMALWYRAKRHRLIKERSAGAR